MSGGGRMTFLRSVRWRLFVVAWILYSVHFATNVVREHYPAFALAEHGTFFVDEYRGFHADIFEHRGHAVVGNQVLVSVLAAVPLFIFDPVLDAVERYSVARLQAAAVPAAAEDRTDKPLRRQFFQLVRERGLDLRFGAATVVTSAFFMAPLMALFLVYFYGVLQRRGVTSPLAVELTFLLGFGTPLFFRASTLNHNVFVMYAMFIAFMLLWASADAAGPAGTRRRLWAGFFAGLTLATDYVGIVLMPLLWGYALWSRRWSAAAPATWRAAVWESRFMVLGSLPPIAFLLYSQWAMYGNPFLPGQYRMPNQNIYVTEGARGFTLPDLELLVMGLFDPSFGLFTWGPVLALALLPVPRSWTGLLVPRLERRWIAAASVALLVFASMNQVLAAAVQQRFPLSGAARALSGAGHRRTLAPLQCAAALGHHGRGRDALLGAHGISGAGGPFLAVVHDGRPAAAVVPRAEHDRQSRQPVARHHLGAHDPAGVHRGAGRDGVALRRPDGVSSWTCLTRARTARSFRWSCRSSTSPKSSRPSTRVPPARSAASTTSCCSSTTAAATTRSSNCVTSRPPTRACT